MVAPRSLCTLPVHAAMRTNICTISGTAMRTRRLLHQGSRAPALPLQAAHNFKKTDQLCQSLKPPFPLNGFDEQESHKVKSRRSKIQIFHPKIDIFGRLYLLLNFRLTIRKYLCLREYNIHICIEGSPKGSLLMAVGH